MLAVEQLIRGLDDIAARAVFQIPRFEYAARVFAQIHIATSTARALDAYIDDTIGKARVDSGQCILPPRA